MNRSILKPVIAGALIGAALFFIPFFVLRVAVFVLIVGLLFRLFGRRSWGPGSRRQERFTRFADKVRNMTDEEYAQFKERFQYGCGGQHHKTTMAQ
ncbi:hypothetical protein U0035_10005 [Niabella yanshanensis]|uniref:Uncharacterized protein n=1 Tax=Niabella yanshanensis TaxID=577386 RepID=A0ABZ0WD22_9BACT|nr:hypothetical protein [Niabella yanshanensis]WQD40480.1 hypothetical protein U0035_10005 [Niabella yanshanensis]